MSGAPTTDWTSATFPSHADAQAFADDYKAIAPRAYRAPQAVVDGRRVRYLVRSTDQHAEATVLLAKYEGTQYGEL